MQYYYIAGKLLAKLYILIHIVYRRSAFENRDTILSSHHPPLVQTVAVSLFIKFNLTKLIK